MTSPWRGVQAGRQCRIRDWVVPSQSGLKHYDSAEWGLTDADITLRSLRRRCSGKRKTNYLIKMRPHWNNLCWKDVATARDSHQDIYERTDACCSGDGRVRTLHTSHSIHNHFACVSPSLHYVPLRVHHGGAARETLPPFRVEFLITTCGAVGHTVEQRYGVSFDLVIEGARVRTCKGGWRLRLRRREGGKGLGESWELKLETRGAAKLFRDDESRSITA